MFPNNGRRVVYFLFSSVVLFGMLVNSRSATFHSPGDCDFQDQSCLAACPIDPATGGIDEVCATQCRYSKKVCENDVFGSNLSTDNFLIAFSTGCETYFLHYRRYCIVNGGMLTQHRPVYDACIASGYSVDDCCTNIANDYANSIQQCTEL